MFSFARLRSGSLGMAGVAMLAIVSPALAQRMTEPSGPPPPTAEQILLQRLQVGTPLERYREALRNEFVMSDADADGQITQRDIDLHTLMEGVQARNLSISTVLRYDLDGDGFVTEDEIRRSMTYELRSQIGLAAYKKATSPVLSPADMVAKQIDTMVRTVMALDTDKDGKVSMAEATKSGAPGRFQNGQATRARQLLVIDGASKGVLTLAEFEAAGEALFAKIDTDKDGTISQQEMTAYRTRAERAGCEMPAASEKARILLLSSYQTEALSSATIGSQDAVVHAGRINVEPGEEPLYVVIASYSPTIWQFSGAVERIERVVATSSSNGRNGGNAQQAPVAGVTGVPRDRVVFPARSNCLSYFSEAPSSGSLQAAGTVRLSAGKAPDVVATRYSVGAYNIPSGRIDSTKEPTQRMLVIRKDGGTLNIVGNGSGAVVEVGPSRARDDMYNYWPGGVVEIAPDKVVASAPVSAYEVLPAQAGLAQLLASGAATQNGAGEYVVRRKIRFPPGLYGAHSVTFLIMKGTDYPDGDPGHSCVVVEDTGESKGAVCRTR
ncbi:EF-hand domain-containing protein [Bradyrhizobium sp.]|uniref:EF-hand domain-containing protein n=1 Tax=Bradyrhizobium sp. TaxID=376 RepID=UPI0039E566A9